MDKSPDEMNERKYDPLPRQSFVNYSDKNAAEIQREIQVTRADMDETVNAIQARLAPQQLVNHAMVMARDVARDAAPRLAEAIRQNPLPTALVALGVGWLFVKAASPPRPRVRGYEREYAGGEGEYALGEEGRYSATEAMDMASGLIESGTGKARAWAGETADRVKDKGRHLADQAKQKASHFAETARQKVDSLKSGAMEKAGEWAGATKHMAGSLAESTRERASHLTHQVGDQARHLGQVTRGQIDHAGARTAESFRENPLAFAALCVGVGVALGLSLPETRKEQELLGETRDKLVDQVKETGQEVLEKVSRVAESGQQAMMEEARREEIF